jgi:hypothetical protein
MTRQQQQQPCRGECETHTSVRRSEARVALVSQSSVWKLTQYLRIDYYWPCSPPLDFHSATWPCTNVLADKQPCANHIMHHKE